MDRPAVRPRTSLRNKLGDTGIRRTGRVSRLEGATLIPTRSCCAIFPVKIIKLTFELRGAKTLFGKNYWLLPAGGFPAARPLPFSPPKYPRPPRPLSPLLPRPYHPFFCHSPPHTHF